MCPISCLGWIRLNFTRMSPVVSSYSVSSNYHPPFHHWEAAGRKYNMVSGDADWEPRRDIGNAERVPPKKSVPSLPSSCLCLQSCIRSVAWLLGDQSFQGLLTALVPASEVCCGGTILCIFVKLSIRHCPSKGQTPLSFIGIRWTGGVPCTRATQPETSGWKHRVPKKIP